MKPNRGFTLIELLIVIAIIGILSTIVLASLNSARAKARDSYRISSIKEVQKALELYYSDNGLYPISVGSDWMGFMSDYGSYSTTGAGGYIPNLAPTYIKELPVDPKQTSSTGYLYKSDGSDYAFVAHGIMESNLPASLALSSDPSDIAVYTPGFASVLVTSGGGVTIPTVTNPTATDITANNVILGATVTSLGVPALISARGICYSTSANPTTPCVTATLSQIVPNVFTIFINSLSSRTTYHYRGYVTNSTGIAYTSDATFTTTSNFVAP